MVANRGMYLEELVNRTANYCFINKIAIIEKREIPIKIIKKINDDTVIGKLTKKSKLDYFCYVNNKYFEFDAKETNEDVFRISNIASHQLEYMHSLSTNMINSYILIYFNKYSKIYMVGYEWLVNNTKDIKYIKYELINEAFKEIEIIYPGILDFNRIINIS